MVKAKGLPSELQTVATLATSADEVLLDRLQEQTKDESQVLTQLAYLRRGMLEASLSDPLSVAKGLLREAVALYAKGEKDQAYQKAVEAYLDGYELAEPTLVAKDASLGRGLEAQYQGLAASIVLTSSANAVVPKHGSEPYDVSKAAINHLIRELAMGLGPLVRVNGIAPATVVAGSAMFPKDRVMVSLRKYEIPFDESEPVESLRAKLAEFYARRTITRRPILPVDCANAICWLAGDQSAKTTGHVIPVDGGLPEAFLR